MESCCNPILGLLSLERRMWVSDNAAKRLAKTSDLSELIIQNNMWFYKRYWRDDMEAQVCKTSENVHETVSVVFLISFLRPQRPVRAEHVIRLDRVRPVRRSKTTWETNGRWRDNTDKDMAEHGARDNRTELAQDRKQWRSTVEEPCRKAADLGQTVGKKRETVPAVQFKYFCFRMVY